MRKGFVVFSVIIVLTVLLISVIGGICLYREFGDKATEEDFIGDWKLSTYYGYSYEGTFVHCSNKDKVTEYDLNITVSGNKTIKGQYGNIFFEGITTGLMFMADLDVEDGESKIFGNMDDKSKIHLGVVSFHKGMVSSSMSVYNRDGSKTIGGDDCKDIVGKWNADDVKTYVQSIVPSSLTVDEQKISIFRGMINYSSGNSASINGFITPVGMGPLHFGMIIDSEGKIWMMMTTRGQIRIMDEYSESLMTSDGGYVQPIVEKWLERFIGYSVEGHSISVEEQNVHLIFGRAVLDKEYVLTGSQIENDPTTVIVFLKSGADEYHGFIEYSKGSVFLAASSSDGKKIKFEFINRVA